MSSAAFRRAQKLTDARPAAAFGARALGLLHSLILLALLAVAGLLLGLVISRGNVRVPVADFDAVPRWLSGGLPNERSVAIQYALLDDVGLYPLVASNRGRYSPWVHRQAAGVLQGVLGRVHMLRRNLSALASLLALALALLVALAILEPIRRRLIAAEACRAAAALRHQVHRQMYRRGQSSLPTEGIGPVVNLFTREVNEVRDGLFARLDQGWRDPALAVGLLLIAAGISLPLTLFLLALAVLVALIARPIAGRAEQEADAAVRDSAVQLALLQEDLAMLRTVRVYGMEGIDKARFDEHLDAYRDADERRLVTGLEPNPTTLLLVGSALALGLGMLGAVVLAGRLSPAAAVVLLLALAGLLRPLSRWAAQRRIVRQAGRSAEDIFQYLDAQTELKQAVGAQFLAPLRDRIVFENVSLNDAAGRPLLAGISLEVPARSRTAILGLDEDAKHALVCLLPRLIDPAVGRVRMDGHDLRDVTLESLRAQIALVLQGDLTFSDTVLANIGLGDASFSLARVIEAAKIAHAHHFIQELPDGYETVIGPLGHYLSPEQQYRVALARAYLHDPSIVIIEEPTTQLDEDTKHLIDDTIDRLAPGRTLVFLPHRLSTIRRCDQVVVLHNGHVEAAGPPREVHGLSKLYRHIQYVEFNQFATGEVEAGQMNG